MTVLRCSKLPVATESGTPAHAFQDALGMLASAADPLPAMLEQFLGERSASPPHRLWKRIFGRFDPDKQPYCLMVYEAQNAPFTLLSVELYAMQAHTMGEAYFHEVLGWAYVTTMESDAKLTTLAQVMSSGGHFQVMRYRPHMRCTLRATDPNTAQVRYAKVFVDDSGGTIHRDGLALWQAAARGELGFQVAAPDHWDAATRTVWQGCVPGKPVFAELASDKGSHMALRLGRACGSLPQSTLRPSAQFTATDQLDATARNATTLLRYVPGAADALHDFLHDLTKIHQQHACRLMPIHAAPHAHQWLVAGQELGLVDFDRFCLGDPELDAATFMAEMDFERSTQVPVAQLNRAFMEGYESHGVSLRKPLLQAYRAHKRLAKALRSARAVRPDGMERALHHLQRARAALHDHAS
jgi:hypothetical protein